MNKIYGRLVDANQPVIDTYIQLWSTSMAEDAPADLIALAYDDPNQALSAAKAEIDRATNEDDRSAISHAQRAKGLAHRARNELDQAKMALAVSIEFADGDAELEAAARATLAGVHTLAGDLDKANEECDRALSLVTGNSRGFPLAQKGLVLQRTGEADGARRYFAEAIPLAQAAGDVMTEANARTNRAILDAYAGRFETASDDLVRARNIYTQRGQRLAAAGSAHNRGFVLGRAGRFGEALAAYDEAIHEFDELGVPTGELLLDQCAAVLAAGLANEAVELAERALSQLRDDGMAATLAEAELVLANARLMAGDSSGAREAALAAADQFKLQSRPVWVALAGIVEVDAAWNARDFSDELVEAAKRTATRLRAGGFGIEAARSMLRAGQVAHELRHSDLVVEILGELVTAGASDGLEDQIVHRTALALLAVDSGRPADALDEVERGLLAVEELQTMVGSEDLRAGLGRHRVDLASLGLRLAIDAEQPFVFLQLLDRSRSQAQTNTAVADDPALREAMAALRIAEADRSELARQAQVDTEAEERRLGLEANVVRLLRRRHKEGALEPAWAISADEIQERLGERQLIAHAYLDGHLWATTINSRGATIERSASVDEIRREGRLLRAALRRMMRPGLRQDEGEAAWRSVEVSGQRLRDWLLGGRLDDHTLVCPPAELLDLPWQALRSTDDCSITIVPSPGRFLREENDRPALKRVTLIGGPGLEHVDAELEELVHCHPGAAVLAPDRASVYEVSRAFAQSDLVHVAAHGQFRADNAMFSRLDFVDGPLTVADLSALDRMPDTVVIAACDSGRHATYPGDEALGLAAGLLNLGVRSVITTVLPIVDERSVPIVVDLHTAVRDGSSWAAGLRGRPQNPSTDDLAATATALSFVAVSR